jgi:tryptophan-rich sensory protein
MTIIVAAGIAILVTGAGGLMTEIGPWYRNLRKPPWQPPNWLFGPAWTLILGLAAWAGVLAWDGAADPAGKIRIMALFAVNLTLHVLWSPLFFRWRRPDWAMIELPFLWLSILALIFGLSPFSSLASWLLVPYISWVTFAGILNLTIVRLNAPFAGRTGMLKPEPEAS